MKRSFAISIIMLNMLLFSGCTGLKEGRTNILNDLVTDDYPRVSMELSEVTSGGATCVLINNSEMDLIYGEDYYIQDYRDGEWYYLDMADDICVDLIGHILLAGSERSIQHNWAIKYGKLDPGKYRVIKNFYEEHYPANTYYVSCEFDICE